MNVIQRDKNGVTLFALEGRIDVLGAADLEKVFQTALSQGKRRVVLDLCQVDFIGSAGMRALADAVANSRRAGGDLKLVGLNRRLMRALDIVGLDTFFSIHDKVDIAVAAY